MNGSGLNDRYARQIALPGFGTAAQHKLEKASVLVVGAGGLGAPVLTYLAGAGVGTIGIVDGDVVSASNLNRQFLFEEKDIGRSKAHCAAERLRGLNSSISVTSHHQTLTQENAADLMRGVTMAVFCLDSIPVRKTASRAAVALGIPYVEGAVSDFHGSMFSCMPGQTACYECLYRHVQGGRQQIPVLGAVAGIVGCHMALATILFLAGNESEAAFGKLITFNALTHESVTLPVERDPDCPACGPIK